MSNTASPKNWVAAIGIFALLASLGVAVITILAVFVGAGVWKGNIEQRVSTVESAQKEQVAAYTSQTREQITALQLSTDRRVTALETAQKEQVAALQASTKEMVVTMEANFTRRIEAIERDRTDKIQDAMRWRADTGAQLSKIDTLLTNQQRQLDLMTGTASPPQVVVPRRKN